MKYICCLMALLLGATLYAERVSITEAGGMYRLSNGELTVLVDKQTGVIRSLQRGKTEIAGAGIMAARLYPPLPDEYGGTAAQPLTQEAGQGTSVSTKGNALALTWETPLGKFTQTLTLHQSLPLLSVDFFVHLEKDAWELSFACPGLQGLDANTSKLYPEAVRGASRYVKLPGHAILLDEAKGVGLAVLARSTDDLTAISASVLGTPEKANPSCSLGINVSPLRLARRASYYGYYTLAVVTSPEEAAQFYSSVKTRDDGTKWELPMVPLHIVSLSSDKLLYQNGDTATVTVSIQNYANTTRTPSLTVLLERDLAQQTVIAKQDVTLPPFSYKIITIPVPIRGNFDGAGLRAVLQSPDRLYDQATVSIGAPTDWRRVFQLAIVYPGPQVSDPVMRLLKENYITATHQFAWYPKEGNLTPETDKYLAHMGHGMEFSKVNIRDFTRLSKQNGIKTNFYWDCYPNTAAGDPELGVKDPTRIAYSDYGQPISGFWGYGPNTYNPDNRAYIADQISKSIDMFGWDSMMIDDVIYLRREPSPFTAYYYRNAKGELAGKALADDPDTAAEQWLTELKARVRAKHPEFMLMGNGLGPEGFLEGTGMGPKLYLATEVVLSELGGGGNAVAEQTGVGTWRGLKTLLDTQHQQRCRLNLDKTPNYVYIPLPYGGDIATRGCLALCFANQHHLYSWWPSPAQSSFGRAMAEYYRFSLRYTDFIYAEDVKWIPTEQVTNLAMTAPTGMAWKEYVYQRKTTGGHDTIVHLVNLPKSERGWRATGDIEVLTNLTVTYAPAPGETLESAWFLSPEGETNAKLMPRRTNQGYALTINRLDGYGMLVLRIKEKGGK
ncbi:MAG: glycoside hydrolase family 66 protein [Armatimonadota bacterium]